MSEARPLGGRVFTIPFLAGVLIILIALYFLFQRFILGLGPVTGMNDGYPWGLWIAYDVNLGTALACGGYAMAILIYVLNKGQYSPLLKPAILTSLFGYVLGGFSVFIDIGRYWQMHNVFLPGYANIHSPLLEVALCIAAYCLILLIEFSPVVLDRFDLEKMKTKLNRVLFIVVALGILLPTMHQSSLGTLMILAGTKLSPLWWTNLLPLLFLIAALLLGYAVVILETSLSGVSFQNFEEIRLIKKVSAYVPWILGLFLLLRLISVLLQEGLAAMFAGDLAGNMFLLENILLILALIVFLPARNRDNTAKLVWAALLLILGAGLYRFNAYLTGFNPGNGWHYFPAFPETMITLGIVAVEVLGFLWIVKRFPILTQPHRGSEGRGGKAELRSQGAEA
ncbi:MAG: Ni/Fe-hydrogenase cytochrome b subunit [Desulfohalobiaceae bacterium]|nr:Ni/Fe-hydrogenase cytochrome b subunit [Desulfohalobiaceae bacterium]